MGIGIGGRSKGCRGAGEWNGGTGRERSRTAESFQEEREMILIYYRQKQEGNYTFLITVFLSLTMMVVIMSILQIWWEGAVL